jgi:hypothetical protein
MLKKSITYTDYDGNERTEDFYFNLSRAEVLEMEMSVNGGMRAWIEKIVAEQDGEKMVARFKDIILKSYGEKSLDGKRFVKSRELTDAFTQTEAYSELFMQLATDAEFAASFINAIIPQMPTDAEPESKPESTPNNQLGSSRISG